jgi:hypothetical protein
MSTEEWVLVTDKMSLLARFEAVVGTNAELRKQAKGILKRIAVVENRLVSGACTLSTLPQRIDSFLAFCTSTHKQNHPRPF